MTTQPAAGWTRRRFLGELSVAGTVGLLGRQPRPLAAEPPPETATVRLIHQIGGTCLAPQYLAEEFLQSEGFTDVHYAQAGANIYEVLASGGADISMAFAAPVILRIDTGHPLVFLSGLHVGCLELFGNARVRTIRDLKGKTVSAGPLGGAQHLFLASMAAYVGVDPTKEINWVTDPAVRRERPAAEWVRLLAEGHIDAVMAAPPRAQAFREQGVGHVVVNMTTDRPWSQYFCCMVVGHRDFVRQHPVATKRVLRALLKAADLCSLEPERTARFLLDKGYTKDYNRFLLDSSAATQYAFALQAIREIPYARWREYDPEDTVRFYALRLHEIGMIRSSPQKIIAQGTEWRFVNELKKELKG